MIEVTFNTAYRDFLTTKFDFTTQGCTIFLQFSCFGINLTAFFTKAPLLASLYECLSFIFLQTIIEWRNYGSLMKHDPYFSYYWLTHWQKECV